MKLKNDNYENGITTFRTVQPEEIDELGHVNNAVYVQWIQDAAISHWSKIANDDLQNDYVWFCSRHEIDYKQQLYLDNKVEIRTWLGQFSGARFNRHVDIRAHRSEKAAVTAKTTWVLISKKSKKPVRVKPEVLNVFS